MDTSSFLLVREFSSFGLLAVIVVTGLKYAPRIAATMERIETKLDYLKDRGKP